MKPFNLQDALSGKPVMLRNGEKAFVRHHDTGNPKALLGYRENVCSWRVDGVYRTTLDESEYDIIGMHIETHIINGFEVPVPETKVPEYATRYYLASLNERLFHSCAIWDDHDMDKLWLERGLVFLNKEDAIANAKAMLGIDPHEGDES